MQYNIWLYKSIPVVSKRSTSNAKNESSKKRKKEKEGNNERVN